MAITLWGRTSSANVQKVRWALAELGLAYEHIPLGGSHGGNRDAAYLALNPNGLVPTLRDGGLVLWESHAILRYLAATYGAGGLWPESPSARAVVDQWTDWTATTFQPAWITAFWQVVRTPKEQHNPAAIAKSLADTEKCLSILEERLARTPYLGGDRLTYADLAAGIAMFRWMTMPVERAAHPAVDAWHRRLKERAAFRDAVEVDYSELVGRLAF
jgi:glutathione S-transferase